MSAFRATMMPIRQAAMSARAVRSPVTTAQLVRQTRGLKFQATPKMARPVPREEHSAHTISQRIRTLKKIPPELIPLGIVLAVAVGAAGYSLIKKLFSDGTLRLRRQGKQPEPVTKE